MHLRPGPSCLPVPWASLLLASAATETTITRLTYRGGLSIGSIATQKTHFTVEETEA